MESIFVICYLKRVAETGSILCLGLSPDSKHVPPTYQMAGIKNIGRYFSDVIEVAARLVPVVKFNTADYLKFGEEGEKTLLHLVEHAHYWNLLVIFDANQRSEEYIKEAFDRYGADACISVPCSDRALDFSCWTEWLKRGHMVIQLIQDTGHWEIRDTPSRIAEWNSEVIRKTGGAGGIGIAIEASPEQVVSYRKLAGDDVFFLIPDYGGRACGIGGLLNSHGEAMGAVDDLSGSILNSWKNEPRKKRPLEPVEAAIMALNAKLKT